MHYLHQKGTKDCFPACFYNAMRHFNIPIIPALRERFDVFNSGTENCTVYASEERLELYYRSIHKLIAEWNWAIRHKDDGNGAPESEEWAEYLLKMGIAIDFRNGPIEHRESITGALSNGKIVICEICISSEDIPGSGFRHFVLIVNLMHGRLFIHDPFPAIRNIQMKNIEYVNDNCGSNLIIDGDYFFSREAGPMKPEPNCFLGDSGYKFMIVG